MRENPIRAFEGFRAKSVSGGSIRKRLERSSSIASGVIIASIIVAKATNTLAPSTRASTVPGGKHDKRLIIKKTAPNSQRRCLSQRFFGKIFQRGQIRTIFVRAANNTV
jgi:hypothetical protein